MALRNSKEVILLEKYLAMEEIIKCICEYYEINVSDIFKQTRKQENVFYRHLFFFISYRCIDQISYDEIAFFSENYCNHKYDHSTVLHGVNSIQNRIETEPIKKKEVIQITNRVKESKLPAIVIKDFDLLTICKSPRFINEFT